MLELKDVSVQYGGIKALEGVNLAVNAGEVVTLIGANGAGKSTTLRVISRLVSPSAGKILFEGQDIARLRPDELVRMGVAHVPEGRRVLARQTIQDNLELGAYPRQPRRDCCQHG